MYGFIIVPNRGSLASCWAFPLPPRIARTVPGGRQPVEPVKRVLLHDGAISRHDREHRFASPIGRWAQQRCPDPAGVQRARDNLMQLCSHDVSVSQAADIDAADLLIRRSGEW